MAEIKVELRDFNNRILGSLDITSSDNFPLSLTYQNFDVRDFNSRNGSFSKTFKIPATKNNNVLLAHIYQDGNVDAKNTRTNIPSTIYSDNIPIVSGNLKVTKVLKDTNVLEYECNFLGDNMDWASTIKNLDLHELRFSNNTYTTYPPTSEGSYVYENTITLAGNARDYTNFNSSRDVLHYPLATYGDGVSSRQQVTEGDFAPAFYLKNIWDKIFLAQGYTVDSEFCNSNYFKSLIVPFDFEIKAQQNNFKYGNITKEGGYTLLDAYFDNVIVGTQPNSIGNVEVNRNGQIPSGTYANSYVKYAFSGDAIVDDADVPASNSTGNVQQGTSGKNTLLVKNLNGVHKLSWDITARFFRTQTDYEGNFKVRGEVWQVEDDDSTDIYAAEASAGDSLGGYTKIWEEEYDEVIDAPYDVTRNWKDDIDISGNGSAKFLFCIQVDADYPSSGDGESVTFGFEGGTFEISGSEEITIGTDLNDIHFFIPDGKQSDFVSGVAQMFNLQFKTDAASKVVKIEPYDYFYKPTSQAVDWTSKIDFSKTIQDEFIQDVKSELIFKYKDASNDAMLERYNKKSSTDWGAYREVDSSGVFSDGTYKVENKYFASSFNFLEYDYVDSDAGHNRQHAANIPMYFNEFSNLDFPRFVERGEKDYGIGARVLITIPVTSGTTTYAAALFPLAGQAASGYSYNSNSEISPSDVFNLKFCRANFIHFPQMTVPTSAIPSDLVATDVDAVTAVYEQRAKLSMGTYNGTEVFLDPNLSFNDIYQTSTQTSFTDNFQFRGLYHTFYNKMVSQLKQKPRIKNIYLNLNQTDIASLDFQRLIFLEGLYYRINKIIDFKPHLKESTKVELVEYFELGKEQNLSGDVFYLNDIVTKF